MQDFYRILRVPLATLVLIVEIRIYLRSIKGKVVKRGGKNIYEKRKEFKRFREELEVKTV